METVACRDRFNKKFRRNKDNLEWLEAIVLAVVAVALIFTFGVRMIRVDGESMLPTLQDGQRLMITSYPYTPQRGDIVVIDAYTAYGDPLVKRVIGIGGDTIDIDFQNGIVYLNGNAVYAPSVLNKYDEIELGKSKFLFVPFCGENFMWGGKTE